MPEDSSKEPNPVAEYKLYLRDCIDRRPSGMRQKIATALGKHKSFVSQITNPAYTVPIPAGDLHVIFDVCHFAPEERSRFLELYERAHPFRTAGARPPANLPHDLRIILPAFKTEAMARQVEKTIIDLANRVIRMAQTAEGESTGENRNKDEQEEDGQNEEIRK